MYVTKKSVKRPNAFTLVELIVVIAIILVIAALAAAFAPRVNDSTNLQRAVDNLEQWLLTAKMRAKRDGVATGIRFIRAQGDPANSYSQLQYIQQPDPLSGSPGVVALVSVSSSGLATFSGVDFTLGGTPLPSQWLVQTGDYLEIRGGGVCYIASVPPGGTTLQLSGNYPTSLSITAPGTSNFRILRQPRILIGEEPLTLPNNFAVITPYSGAAVLFGPSGIAPEILFSPTGAVIGTNAGSGKLYLYVHDVTQTDPNMAGIVAVQSRTGFIGAYSVAPGGDPFAFAEIGRESGL